MATAPPARTALEPDVSLRVGEAVKVARSARLVWRLDELFGSGMPKPSNQECGWSHGLRSVLSRGHALALLAARGTREDHGAVSGMPSATTRGHCRNRPHG